MPKFTFHAGILEKGKEITLADIFVERVRESEKRAIERKRKAQSEAKELIEQAKRDGEKRLALAERDASLVLSLAAKADAESADKLYHEAADAAKVEAAALEKTAEAHMDEAVALILRRVGGVWQ